MLDEDSIRGGENDGVSLIITKPVYDQDEAFNFVGGTKLPLRQRTTVDVDMSKLIVLPTSGGNVNSAFSTHGRFFDSQY